MLFIGICCNFGITLDTSQGITLMSGCGAWSIDGSLIEPSEGLSNLGYVWGIGIPLSKL